MDQATSFCYLRGPKSKPSDCNLKDLRYKFGFIINSRHPSVFVLNREHKLILSLKFYFSFFFVRKKRKKKKVKGFKDHPIHSK
jgi:hypothetical protein